LLWLAHRAVDGLKVNTEFNRQRWVAAAASPEEERARRVEEFRRLINPLYRGRRSADRRRDRSEGNSPGHHPRARHGPHQEGRPPLEEARSDAGL